MISDSFHRQITYLRVSVTDRCNLRCVYCLPEDYAVSGDKKEILTYEELTELIHCFAELGFSRIRITGGEPLVRHGITQLVSAFAETPGIKDLAMSTNGLLLEKYAGDLAKAGLKRINISLDSINPEKFSRITRYGRIESVLRGIYAAAQHGINPVKLNVVVVRGVNSDEIGDFCELTAKLPIHVRFIELMPMGETGFFSEEKRVPYQEMLNLADPLIPLEKRDWPEGGGPAHYFKRPGAVGTIGFISALSCNFCDNCNRVRLSSKGVLVPCLDGWMGVPLGEMLRKGGTKEEIKTEILKTIENKPQKHFMVERAKEELHHPSPRFMCSIGG